MVAALPQKLVAGSLNLLHRTTGSTLSDYLAASFGNN